MFFKNVHVLSSTAVLVHIQLCMYRYRYRYYLYTFKYLGYINMYMYFQVLDIESTQVPRYLGACTKFYAFKYMRVLIHAGYMRRNFHGRMDTDLVWHLLMKVLRYNPGTGIFARDPKNPIWYRGTCTPRLDLDRVSISSV